MAEKILIIDDDLETLRLVGLMLQRQGYQILSARNGVEGINQAVIDNPDLIVLDIMMPDMDGYQVARALREHPVTAAIPILMFTAKSQVDDKVNGYDAGADDYMTKPVHPGELIAHIKTLLARSKNRSAPSAPRPGTILGLLAAKGGMGISSLTLNLALAYQNYTHFDVIAAEIRAGQGTWAGELELGTADGLNNLLTKKIPEITVDSVENELTQTAFGIRLLLASPKFQDFVILEKGVSQLDAVLNQLGNLKTTTFLDIGSPFIPGFDRILSACDELILCAEPQPYSLHRTAELKKILEEKGFGKSRPLHMVILNRIRADLQVPANLIQEILGCPIMLVIPPAPEQSYNAAMRGLPMLQIQPDGVFNVQINRLAKMIAERLKK